MKLLVLSNKGKHLIFCLYGYLLCQRGNRHFVVRFWQISLLHFPSKDGKDAAYEGRNGWKGVFFPPESAYSVFIVIMIKVPFPVSTLTGRVKIYISRQGKGINRKNESTIIITLLVCHCSSLIECFGPTQLTVIDWKLFSFKRRIYIFVAFKNCFKKYII